MLLSTRNITKYFENNPFKKLLKVVLSETGVLASFGASNVADLATISFDENGSVVIQSSPYGTFVIRTQANKDIVFITGNGKAIFNSAVQGSNGVLSNEFVTVSQLSAATSGGTTGTTENDIEIMDATKGIIMRTGDGTRARITLIKETDGTLNLQISDPL